MHVSTSKPLVSGFGLESVLSKKVMSRIEPSYGTGLDVRDRSRVSECLFMPQKIENGFLQQQNNDLSANRKD